MGGLETGEKCHGRGENIPTGADLMGPTEPKPPMAFCGAALLELPTCPKPSLATPAPNLSTSELDLPALADDAVAPNPPRLGLAGAGAKTLDASVLAPFFFVSASASSASGSYPSFSMRSASSLALFSASSKSMTSLVTFLAPSLVDTFFAPRTPAFLGPVPADLRSAAECVMRLAAGLDSVDDCLERADVGREASLPLPLPLPERGDAVRPMTGGVAVREMGGVGRLMAGLSQEEKKSSSGSSAAALPSSAASVMTTSSGYL